MKKQLVLVKSMSFSDEHGLLYQVEGTDIFHEIVTPVSKTGRFGKSKKCWYHRDDPKIHKSYEAAARFKP